MVRTPKWFNNERKQTLVKIFLEYPDNCLQGHFLCPIASHYEHIEHKTYTYAIQHNVTVKIDDTDIHIDDTMPVYEIREAERNNVTHKRKHEQLIDNAVECWRTDSRIEQHENWLQDRRELHKLNERSFPLRGRFNNISSVIFHENQPLYYFESIGMNGLTMQPYAKVKLASSKQYLFVELGNSLQGISKHRKRKILKYGKQPNDRELETIDTKVKMAVRAYLGY